MGYGRDDRSSISGKVKMSLLYSVQTGSAVYPVSYQKVSGCKANHSQSVMMELYLHFPHIFMT
jgi:hypothetical protein